MDQDMESRYIRLGLSAVFFLLFFNHLLGTSYYISPLGNDHLDGMSPQTAWQSLARVQSASIQAGDSLLLEGGQRFLGKLSFDSSRIGSSTHPLHIGSYGNGRATLVADGSYGLFFDDCAGVEISHLIIQANDPVTNEGDGILFRRSTAGSGRKAYIRIEKVEVSGFKWGGITIDSQHESFTDYGYEDIQIKHVIAHHNGDHGIELRGHILTGEEYAHQHIRVEHCTAYQNKGIPSKNWSHSGNGIVLGNVDQATISYCLAYENGGLNIFPDGGPVGIWLWDTRDGIIQHCESHHNETGNSKDGGGFDLDGGCVNCLIQYCYSHDNAGPGYLLAAFPGARPMYHNTLRFNISQNDAQKNSYGSMTLWRHASAIMEDVFIHHNTIYLDTARSAQSVVFRLLSHGVKNARLVNNIFLSANGFVLLDNNQDSEQEVLFQNNLYHAFGQSIEIQDQESTFFSLDSWRAATGQEQLLDPATGNPVHLGGSFDPMLSHPGGGMELNNPLLLHTLPAYRSYSPSPLSQLSWNVAALGISVGSQDFFGQQLPAQSPTLPGADALPGFPATLNVPKSEASQLILSFDSLNHQLNLQFPPTSGGSWKLEIINLQGQRIWKESIKNTDSHALPLPPQWPSQMYKVLLIHSQTGEQLQGSFFKR